VSRHPQNGPTFSKSPKKQKLMTDDERAVWQARKDAELEQTKRDAAKSASKLHTDDTPFCGGKRHGQSSSYRSGPDMA
jgi:hypothetical protein